MRINDIPEFKDKGRVFTMTGDKSVLEAVQAMAARNIGSVVIVDHEGRLEGIFTERDVLNRVAAEQKDMSALKLAEVMTRDICSAREEDNVYDTMRRMSQGRFRHMPVVNDGDTVVGLLSIGDFLALTWGDLVQRAKEVTRASFSVSYQIWLIIFAVMIYTLFLIAFLGS